MGLDLCRLPHTYLISELIVLIFSLLPRSVFSKLSKLWGLQMVEQHSNCGLKAVDKRIPAQVTGDQHQTLWADPDGQRYPGKFPVRLCWQKLWFKEFVCVILWTVFCVTDSPDLHHKKIITCTVYTWTFYNCFTFSIADSPPFLPLNTYFGGSSWFRNA